MKTDIKKFNPCGAALFWFNKQESDEQAWNNCHRGDWMMWIAVKLGVDKRKLTLAAGLCAKTVIHLMEDKRSVSAVNAAIDYGNGKISIDELVHAKYAAADAYASTASSTDAAFAAYTAAAAASSTSASTAASASAYASVFAFASADDAEGAKKENLLKTANICRAILTESVFELLK